MYEAPFLGFVRFRAAARNSLCAFPRLSVCRVFFQQWSADGTAGSYRRATVGTDVTVERHCFATVNLDHVNAVLTCVLRREVNGRSGMSVQSTEVAFWLSFIGVKYWTFGWTTPSCTLYLPSFSKLFFVL
jgi:hypothetical protein